MKKIIEDLHKSAINYRYSNINYNLAKECYLKLLELESNSNIMVEYALFCKDVEEDIELAIEYLLKAVELDNSDAMGHLGYIYQYIVKDYKLMKKYYQMSIDNGNISHVGNFGCYYYTIEKDFKNAIKYFELGVKFECTLSMYYLGDYYWNEELDNENAIKYYKMAVRNNDEDAMREVGIIYFHLHDLDNAEKYLKMSYDVDKDNIDTNICLGRLYIEKDDIETAEIYFDNAMEIDDNDNDALIGMGILLYHKEQYENAMIIFKNLVKLESNNDLLLLYMGMCYQNMGDYKMMEYYYLMAIDNNNSIAMYMLGRYYSNINDVRSTGLVIHYMEMAIKAKNTVAMLYMAKYMSRNAHRPKDIIFKYYVMAINLGNKNADYELARYYHSIGYYHDAKKYYLRAITNNISDAMIGYADLCLADMSVFGNDLAEKYYLMALSNKNKKVFVKLGKFYENRNLKNALHYYDKAIDNGENDICETAGNLCMLHGKNDDGIKYLKLAIDRGYYKSALRLGNYYYRTLNDLSEAKKYYKIAIENGINIKDIKLTSLEKYYYLDIYSDEKEVNVFRNKTKLLGKMIECEVCMDNKLGIPFECAHYVCQECYLKLYNKSCPFCRMEFSSSLYYYF